MAPKKQSYSQGTEPDFQSLPLNGLLLDPNNPRLRSPGDNTTQIELAREIAEHFDALSLARLIAHNGFYKSAALLVYPTHNGKFIVAEGNRRLTALLGLTDESMRKVFDNKPEWQKLSDLASAKLSSHVPVYVFEGPSALRPILAAEHLNRKLSWEPFQKAREIVNLVDIEGHSFSDISEFSGIPKPELRSMYRDFKLAKSLTRKGFSEVLLTTNFSRVSEITKIKSLRDFSGVPDDKDVEAGPINLESDKSDELIELFEWVFGEDNVTPDTRQIRELGKVITEQESLEHLRLTKDLDEAMQVFKLKTENNIESTSKTLNRALDQIERLIAKIFESRNDPVLKPSIERAKKLARDIESL